MPDDVTSLSGSGASGEHGDPELAYETGKLLGEQVHALEFNLAFAPNMDVSSNPNTPVIGDRSCDGNPYIML